MEVEDSELDERLGCNLRCGEAREMLDRTALEGDGA